METTLPAKLGVRHHCTDVTPVPFFFFTPTNPDPNLQELVQEAEKDNCAFLLFGFCRLLDCCFLAKRVVSLLVVILALRWVETKHIVPFANCILYHP
jgi:hypothetical protein